jgi:hypothetical protein
VAKHAAETVPGAIASRYVLLAAAAGQSGNAK